MCILQNNNAFIPSKINKIIEQRKMNARATRKKNKG